MYSAQSDPKTSHGRNACGWGTWVSSGGTDSGSPPLPEALARLDVPFALIAEEEELRIAYQGHASIGTVPEPGAPIAALVPAIPPEQLGDASFLRDHKLRYACIAGAMANGIGSVEIVAAMGRAGMLGFFGSAGLPPQAVREAIERIQSECGDRPYGVNFIHSPNESDVEDALADLFIEKGVRLVEASAFIRLTPALIRYRLHGIHETPEGRVEAPNRIIAKVSREEIAEKFLSPPPEKILAKLVEAGSITEQDAKLAKRIPVAQDVTAEADSGGHTDHRPALSLLPTLASLRDRIQHVQQYDVPLRIGLGGGIATPESAAAAFAMGAAYIMTGTVNQACRESGTSDTVRQMLAEARQADVARAPAADMFEMGVTVQVLKRGTMFAMRGSKLYELYRKCGSLEEIPADEREKLEKQAFRKPLEEIWNDTRAFFTQRDPRQIERAERDPKHKMALVFRWYLGQSSNWANKGIEDRVMDYQVWCGPAMGAFNEWARGSQFESWENRHVAEVNRNILYGAGLRQRVASMRAQGVAVSEEDIPRGPWTADELKPYFHTNTNS